MNQITLVVVITLSLAAAARSQQSVTTIEITDAVLHKNCKKIGMNLGGDSAYSSAQLTRVRGTLNFEGSIRRYISFGPLAGDGRVSDWYKPGVDWSPAGWSYRILTGESRGVTGTVKAMDTENFMHGGSPKPFTRYVLDKTFPMSSDDSYLFEKEDDAGWVAPGEHFPAYTRSGEVDVSLEYEDLPPGTTGKVCLRVKTGMKSYQTVMLKVYPQWFEVTGRWLISFRAKSLKPDCTVRLYVHSGSSQTNLTQEWKDYEVEVVEPHRENRTGIATVGVSVLADSEVLLDDIVVEKLDEDTNPTVFRDAVIRALKEMQGEGGSNGVLRYWAGQLGDTIENQLRPRLERKAHTKAASSMKTIGRDKGAGTFSAYALHEFLELCELVNMEPWYCTPGAIDEAAMQNLIEYLAGDASTPYGRIRAARGRKEPWTDAFPLIHLEIGNEAWNRIFHGGGIERPPKYVENANIVFAAAKASPYYVEGKLRFHLGTQSGGTYAWRPGYRAALDGLYVSVAPYITDTLDAEGPTIWQQATAEPEQATTVRSAGVTAAAVAEENPTLGMSVYEVNYHLTGQTKVPAEEKNGLVAGVGGAVNIANYLMLLKKRLGIEDVCFFTLAQNQFQDVRLWGAVYDLKQGSERRRPNFLALSLLNRAIRGDMLETRHGGANPTWDFRGAPKPETRQFARIIDLDDIPRIYSYAFRNGEERSVILFNLHETEVLPVSLAVGAGPRHATLRRLTSANMTDSNEAAETVKVTEQEIADFADGYRIALPPFSLTVVSWRL